MELKALLLSNSANYGINLSDAQWESFYTYMKLLKEWNEKINLTAITDEREIVIKHFVDSLSIFPHLPSGSFSMIDVGTGAGFPGIPVKIVKPDISLTLMDSLNKRVKFLDEVINTLDIEDCNTVHLRAEDGGKSNLYREKYDVCTARAVARLPILAELCIPFVKLGGVFIAMKGIDKGEISESEGALKTLGGEIVDIREFNLNNNDMGRTIVKIKKVRQTPTKFPRNPNKITSDILK